MKNLVERNTINVLYTALHSAVSAKIVADDQLKKILVKSAIVNVVFSLESLSNSMLSELPLGAFIAEKVDRFPLIDKIDFLHLTKTKRNIDRGRRPYQEICELVQLRDKYVHQKVSKLEVIFHEVSPGHKEVRHGTKNCKILKIPFRVESWNPDHAITAIKSLVGCISHFLLVDMGYSVFECKNFLFSSVIQDEKKLFLELQSMDSLLDVLLAEYNLIIPFINKSTGGA